MYSIFKRLNVLYAVLIILTWFAIPAIAADTVTSEEGRRIKAKELKELVDKGETVLIVDVRSSKEFNELHVRGAISVPLPQVEAKLGPLSPETRMAFY
jgi:predicted sulfurtransferase